MRLPIFKLKLIRGGWIAFPRIDMEQPQLAAYFLHKMIGQAAVEHAAVLYLDPVQQVLGSSVIGMGDLGRVNMIGREIFKGAILANAASVIVSHNHPGPASSKPSPADIRVTRQLIRAGEIIGIKLLDHIILTPGQDFTSVRQVEPGLWLSSIAEPRTQQQQQLSGEGSTNDGS